MRYLHAFCLQRARDIAATSRQASMRENIFDPSTAGVRVVHLGDAYVVFSSEIDVDSTGAIHRLLEV